ncbi:MAG: hypothetical protein LAP40_04065 [Acidobacteriia bacterium]|nr:hypothetical protein [Terriglobia bacterium]
MTRRGLILACAAFPLCTALHGDDAQQAWDLFTELAAALSSGNAAQFLSYFDREMPGYAALATDVAALVLQADVHSSIELLSNEGNDAARTVELDWYLQIVEQQDAGGSTQRRERIRCRLVKQRNRWKISALEPLSFFAPPKVQ